MSRAARCRSLVAFIVCAAILLGLSSQQQLAGAGTSVSGSSPFLVTYDGASYHADSQSTSSSYTGTLKFVVENAVGELEQGGGGGTVEFAAGTFDLGSDSFKLEPIHNITFQGQGIDVTVIQNVTTAAADLEPFSFFGAFGVTVRDMTVSAGGPERSTSDALDFDNGSDSLVERVKITASRGRGIVFDGKDAGFEANGNVVRDCIIDGVFSDGIEMIGASRNVVAGCSITNVGGHGISATKSSASAPQPNKQSSDNVISNNIVENAGQDGIRVNSSDRNRIDGNQVTNSGTVVAGDGIRILTENGIPCDDNVVGSNLATDTQATKTQRYGLNIASPLCNRTVVADGNDFSGNDVAAINDLGTATQYGTDTVPPAAPSGLTATAVYKTQIDLDWIASGDPIGVYEIWRDGSLLETVGAQTTYADTTVAAGSTHSYELRARDASGNLSAFSNPASATTPTVAVLFHDGFETGDLAKWTSGDGLVAQQQEVFAGSWAARAMGTNTAAFATKQLTTTESNLYTQLHFKVLSQATNVNLLRFRTGANDAILTLFVSTLDRIGYRNEVSNVSTTSTVSAARGAWHTLQVHVSINGAASQTEVWLDGMKIDALSATQSLGTDAIGRLELGDNSINHTYDVALDDVDYDREPIADFVPPATVPGAPTAVAASAADGSADLSWTAPVSDGGAAISDYEITAYDGATPLTPVLVGSAATTKTVTGLSNGTAYTFKVAAINSVGSGPQSTASNTITPQAPATVPGAPTAVAASAADGSADLSWTAPVSDGGAAISDYEITAYDGATPLTPVLVGSAATTKTVTGLSNGTAYTFKVAAINSVGSGPQSTASNTITPQAPATVPGAPTAVAASAADGSADLSWTAPVSDGGAAISDYEITAYDGATPLTPVLVGSAATTKTVTGLSNGTAYTFKVAAINSVGSGPQSTASNTITPQAPATVPGAPTAVAASAADGSADLSWTAPVSDGGAAISDYEITAYDGATPLTPVLVGSAATTKTVTGLSNGTAYTFKVAAINSVGSGPQSTASNTITPQAPATVPGAPTAVAASAADGSADLSWTAPVSDGGAAISDYEITAYDGATPLTPVLVGSAATTKTVTGLSNGTAYTFKVAAINSVGSGPQSTASNTITPQAPATVPGAPTAVAASAADGSADLSWTAPVSDGGAAISDYEITAYDGATPLTPVLVGSAATTKTVTGLSNGTAYTFKVAAINSVGSGPQSTASNTITPQAPATVPGAPTAVAASAADGSADLSWTAPVSDGGAAISDYEITAYDGATPLTPVLVGSAATTKTVTGLSNGTAYTFKVAAINSVGSGPQSTASNTITPQAPGGSGSTPGDFDGDGITDIAVYRPGGGTWYVNGGATTQWGNDGDIPVPGNYDADAATEIAAYRPSNGTWYVNGGATTQWGLSTDIPVPGDYNGDGIDEIAVYRPGSGTWYVNGGATTQWGNAGDIPVPGNYDADAATEIAVYRPSNGSWYVNGGATTQWGLSTDIPVPGDYNGDGIDEIAVYRPGSGTWYVNGGATTQWGNDGDIPVPGNYDADAATEIAAYRPSNGTWYVNGGATTQWGLNTDIPLPLPPATRLAFFP